MLPRNSWICFQTSLHSQLPAYRGRVTAPLDERWFRGGWTSHFLWNAEGAEAYLDVFGVAPPGSFALGGRTAGVLCVPTYAGRNETY
jgi:hypothetical protein